MGAIKDIVDLSTQLAKSTTDRKVTTELMKIVSLTIDLQSEQANQHEQNIKLREDKLELIEENNRLKNKIKNIIVEKDFTKKLSFDGRFYWLSENKESQQKEGPFCQTCYDKDNKLVRLQACHGKFSNYTGLGWMCTVCKKRFPSSGSQIII